MEGIVTAEMVADWINDSRHRLSGRQLVQFWTRVDNFRRMNGFYPDRDWVFLECEESTLVPVYDPTAGESVRHEHLPQVARPEGWEKHPAIEELFLLFKGERNREVLRNWFTKNIYVERCQRRADGHMYTQLGILGEMRGEVFVEPDHLAPIIWYPEERDQSVSEHVADSIGYAVSVGALQEEVNRMVAASQNVNPIMITEEDVEAFFREPERG